MIIGTSEIFLIIISIVIILVILYIFYKLIRRAKK